MRAEHDQIPETALTWHRAGKGAALATVIETWGSAPRPVGSQLVISGEGEMMGSVSGGCVEGAVVVEAIDALESGECQILEFGVSDDDAFAVGLACGGTIRVMVEPIGTGRGWSEDLLAALVSARKGREAVAVETVLPGYDRRLVTTEAAPGAFAADKSGFADEDKQRFLAIHNPPLRLAVVGAVHIAQPLAVMARTAGYDTTIIDPRAAFGSEARFPGEQLVEDWPDEALRNHGLDARTAVVTLTHDPKIDDPALREALRSPVFYIGALGSTRTHAKRVTRLTEAGFAAEEIARIDAPIGLDIGARSPAEIAISVMAEMTERLRRPATRPGRMAGQAAQEVA
ncbi:XdhC family protein [Rhodobacteraceae bacterium NNCM2]|nr:XdhC family protein [Coraliihabitans acroporae]